MKNKCCSIDQRINEQQTYQWTTEVVPSSGKIHASAQYVYQNNHYFEKSECPKISISPLKHDEDLWFFFFEMKKTCAKKKFRKYSLGGNILTYSTWHKFFYYTRCRTLPKSAKNVWYLPLFSLFTPSKTGKNLVAGAIFFAGTVYKIKFDGFFYELQNGSSGLGC